MKILILVFTLVISVSGQTPADQNGARQVAFTGVDRIGEANARSFFVFSTSIRNYAVRHDGHSESSSTTTFRKNFDLRMGGPGRLERLYFAEFEGDVLIEYEVGSPRGFWGYLMRMDQKTMKVRWITPLSCESLGPGLVDQQDLYITAANWLAKLDVRTGAFLWQQSELERFYSFSLPAIKGESIVVRDESETERTIEVERQTGRLIKH